MGAFAAAHACYITALAMTVRPAGYAREPLPPTFSRLRRADRLRPGGHERGARQDSAIVPTYVAAQFLLAAGFCARSMTPQNPDGFLSPAHRDRSSARLLLATSAACDDRLVQIAEAGRFAPAADGSPQYTEQLRVPTLSVGTYSIPSGAIDAQTPHDEDEVYFIVNGRGSFTAGGRTAEVGRGTTLFVPAGEEHRFHDVTEDLAVLVVFAPAYSVT
jgi:mannose-6-phosphate isomerase-like protein (cupin superfamily)